MRTSLPSLDLLRGFDAAARHLSFTRAALELHVTQSAVSRQIKTLEERLGLKLFRRLNRALLLTEEGQALAQAVGAALADIERAVTRLSVLADDRPVTVTTTVSFAALWLVPRLARFRAAYPHADIRIDANNEFVDLERGRIDLAVRFCKPGAATADALSLIGEDVFPVASPALARDPARPLISPMDLRKHVLLHYEDPRLARPWLAWPEWLHALKVPDLKPAGSLRFSHYDQVIRAAIDGEGVALGRAPLLERQLVSGELIALFRRRVTVSRKYFLIVAPWARERPHVRQFMEWLLAEAKHHPDTPPESGRSGSRLKPAS
jgi:LysR family transcriptional regulator, glycine cleavage system transcriptional activator